jgi:hypothetical protein
LVIDHAANSSQMVGAGTGRVGGLIRFFTVRNMVLRRVDLAAASEAGRQVSSTLLCQGEIVNTRED